jgi:23S rRNA pseudouridine2605 synthase
MSNETPRRPLSLKRHETAPSVDASRITERLHKVLAQAGLGSRRALEQRIADGMIKVNGEVAQTGMSISGGDKIEVDGKTFVASALTDPSRVLMYNKPEGEVTTREDPEGRPTIFDSLPNLKGARWIAIGRLDINTTGLLLLTTDGELANAMMHPSHEVEREYVCRVRAPEGDENVSDKIVDRLARGVALEDGPAKFDEIERVSGSGSAGESSHDWFRVLLKEGRNREVRRLWESQGCQVSRLKRIRYGQARLPQPLLRGQSQELPQAEVDALRKAMGLEDDGTPSALTLMPVLGQRKAGKTVVAGNARSHGYVGGHTTADEGRELRRFDHMREDRGRRGGKKPSGGLTVSGDQAAAQRDKRMKIKGPRQPGQRMRPGEQRGAENPAAMRTWFVPDGVDTGPSGHRNPGNRGPRKFTGKPRAQEGGFNPDAPRPPRGPRREGGFNPDAPRPPRGPRREGGFNPDAPRPPRGPRREGGFNPDAPRPPRGPRREGGFNPDAPRPARAPKPYGHPDNAPFFPSDHSGGGFNPYANHSDVRRPRGSTPGGNGPGRDPRGPRPGGGAGRGAPRKGPR